MSSTDELFEAIINRESYVTVDDKFVVINVKYAYKIERSRCDTQEKILGWIVHLCEKTWITPDVLREFAYVAAQAAGTEIIFA